MNATSEEREAFEAVMRLHFKLPNATFDWSEDVPWMTDPGNTNGDIIDCDDFWIGLLMALVAIRKDHCCTCPFCSKTSAIVVALAEALAEQDVP